MLENLDSGVLAERLSSGLQSRLVLTPFGRQSPIWHFIYLLFGELQIRHAPDEDTRVVTAPALVLCPPGAATLTLAAGAEGMQVSMTELGLSGVIGSRPESAELRLMATELVVSDLVQGSPAHTATEQSFHAIIAETQHSGLGAQTVIEAQTRCALVHLWRSSAHAAPSTARDAIQTLLLRRFRRMLEAQFRNRWRVQDYAAALGTTTDRLHDITTTALGRTPISLIHERSLFEAKALLQRSNMTVEQVANFLGFQSAAQFSNFFQRLADQRPGRFRKAARAQAGGKSLVPEHLTEWP